MIDAGYYKKYEPVFGAWYIRRKIGQGAIGQVFEIQREDLGTTYKAALKAISIPEGPEDIQSVLFSGVERDDLKDYYHNLMETVITEFQYLAKLKGNSYIVSYEDHQIIEHEDGIGWDILIKTELLTPLVEYSIRHTFTERDVLKLGIDICRALEFCGQYDIIHRDIKPDNIFLAPSGDFKLGDFGIARVVEETQMSLSRKGTYSYMAPEVFHGHRYGPSADLYSLGIVMYKYLNHGRNPFMPAYPAKIVYDDSEKAFVKRMAGTPLPDPAQGSGKLHRIIRKACAHDHAERYQTAREMRLDLEKLYVAQSRKEQRIDAKNSAPGLNHSTTSDAIEKRIRRNRRIGAGVIAGIVACSGVIYAAIPKAVTDIKGVPASIELYYDGSKQLETVVKPDWFHREPVRYQSSDDGVFTVTPDGKLEAVKIGEAELSVSAKEYRETARVTVVPKVTEVSGLKNKYTLEKGEKKTLKPKLSPAKFSDEPITFTSKDKKIAKISKKGVITAVKKGTVKVVISAGGTTRTVKVKVTDPPPEPVAVDTGTTSSYDDSSNYGGSNSSSDSGGSSSGKSSSSDSSSKGSSKKSGGSSKNSGSGNSSGFFESGDDEYFD